MWQALSAAGGPEVEHLCAHGFEQGPGASQIIRCTTGHEGKGSCRSTFGTARDRGVDKTMTVAGCQCGEFLRAGDIDGRTIDQKSARFQDAQRCFVQHVADMAAFGQHRHADVCRDHGLFGTRRDLAACFLEPLTGTGIEVKPRHLETGANQGDRHGKAHGSKTDETYLHVETPCLRRGGFCLPTFAMGSGLDDTGAMVHKRAPTHQPKAYP